MQNIVQSTATEISISVVSHGQVDLIADLLRDADEHCHSLPIELILTLNLDEELSFDVDSFSFPIEVVRNTMPHGFGTNHNRAFARARGRFFCVMNPDIRIDTNPFPALIACLQNPSMGMAAPVVLSEGGAMEDSARRFPTPLRIFCKLLGGCKSGDYAPKDETLFPDWVGGMFMLIPRGIFEDLGGFDERYFLYYEDVDLCARLKLNGYRVALCPASKVVHHARRSSHRNIKYLRWHMVSMLRFFLSPPFLKICWQRLMRQSL